MLFKRHLTVTVIRLKTMGKLAYVPLLVIFIFLPLVFLLSYVLGRFEISIVIAMSKIILPIFSSWWILFILREFVESEGNEILYVYSEKSQCISVLLVTLFYLCCESAMMMLCMIFYPEIFLDYIHVTLLCVFYAGFSYFFVFLTKSIAITFIPLLVGAAMPFINKNFIGFNDSITLNDIFLYYVPVGVVGLVFFLIGHLLNKKFLKYN